MRAQPAATSWGTSALPVRRTQIVIADSYHRLSSSCNRTYALLSHARVHRLEFFLRCAVGIVAVLVVGDDVVAGLVVRLAFLGLHAAGVRRNFGPHGCDLDVHAGEHSLIGSSEDLGIHGVDVASVVDEPVAGLRALRAAPFAIDESIRFEVEP